MDVDGRGPHSGSRVFCPVPGCPCSVPSHTRGWCSVTTMQSHVDAHMAGTLAGAIPAAWLQQHGRQRCAMLWCLWAQCFQVVWGAPNLPGGRSGAEQCSCERGWRERAGTAKLVQHCCQAACVQTPRLHFKPLAPELEPETVVKALRSFPPGTSPGPTGLRAQHLLDAMPVGDENSLIPSATHGRGQLARARAGMCHCRPFPCRSRSGRRAEAQRRSETHRHWRNLSPPHQQVSAPTSSC